MRIIRISFKVFVALLWAFSGIFLSHEWSDLNFRRFNFVEIARQNSQSLICAKINPSKESTNFVTILLVFFWVYLFLRVLAKSGKICTSEMF